jgi:hypothetical protein
MGILLVDDLSTRRVHRYPVRRGYFSMLEQHLAIPKGNDALTVNPDAISFLWMRTGILKLPLRLSA